MAKDEGGVVEINWVANPFRGDDFEAAWRPYSEAVLRFGATAWALLRAKDDKLLFTQLAVFESKLDFERYWDSEEISEARIRVNGLYTVPLQPKWHSVAGSGQLVREEVS
jgi:hypothetical protein